MKATWKVRVLWFLLGAVVSGLLTISLVSRATPTKPAYDTQYEVEVLKNRVYNLEQYNKARDKAEQDAAKRAVFHKEGGR